MKTKQAALIIERLPLDVLKPHPRNPRVHPDPGTPEWEALRQGYSLADHEWDLWKTGGTSHARERHKARV